MDFWHAITGKIGTDDARGAQADLKLSVHQVRLLPPVFGELACTSLIHCSEPVESLFETAHNSQLGGLKNLQMPPGFCGSQWFLQCAHPMLSACTDLFSPEQLSTVTSFLSSQQKASRDCKGNHPLMCVTTHTLLQLLSTGTKLHSILSYNLQLIQMPVDNA